MTPLAALQATLAAEHAAVYVLGVLGARVSATDQPALAGSITAAYVAHRGRRDQLGPKVRSSGGEPVAAAVSYRLPGAARTASQLRAAGLLVERRCTATYAAAVGATAGADRRWAVAALTDAAVRQLSFGGAADPYPGVAEL